MLSRIATCCKNFQILLHLLSKFHGLGEKRILELPHEILPVGFKNVSNCNPRH